MSKHKDRAAETQPQSPDWGLVLARVLVGGLFVLSGFSKATAPAEAFAASLEAYKLFPAGLMMPIAHILPWVELIAGACLALGYFIRPASAAILAMLAGFEIALMSVVARGINLESCGCYGAWGPKFTPPQAIVFDLFLAVMALYVITRKDPKFLSLDGWIEKGS